MSVGKYRDPVTGEWKKVGGSAGSIPSKLPNPYPLTINGEAYDGSKATEIETPGAFMVTATPVDETTAICDKTYEEIETALSNGYSIVCNFNGTLLPLVALNGVAEFSVTLAIYDMFATVDVQLNQDGSVTWFMRQTTSMPNPNALTINGTSYDGSEAVEVNVNDIHYIVGNGTTAGVWTGTCEKITKYYDGLTILYKLNVAGVSGGSSLNINDLGAVGVYRNASTAVTTTYAAGSVLLLTYSDGKWLTADYDVNTKNTTGTANKGDTKLYLAGATSQTSSGATTYTNKNVYIGTDNRLYSNGEVVPNAAEIDAQIDAKIASIPTGSGDNVPDYVRTEAERVAAVVQERQNENTITAILSSDYHLPNPSHAWYKQILDGITHAGQAMDILRNQISIDFEAKLGDLIYDLNETQEEALASFRMVHSLTADSGADRFEANGNHDHLQSNATPFTHAQVYANNGIYNKGCVRDPANRVGGYCYRDYEEFKLRVVLLNTSEATDGSFALSSAQLAWLDTAFDVPVEEGWGILILSHHPLDWGGSNTAVMKKIKAASGIIANLHGHVHTYTQDVITGTDIPRLAIPNACFYRNNEYGQNAGAENSEGIEFGTTTTYNKTAGTANDTAFCVLTIDREAGMLYLDRYGAGIDREAVVPNWNKKASNLVESAEEMDSDAIYNGGKGYKDTYYLTGETSNFENGDNNTFVTGFMPYTVETSGVPGTIYIKGAEWTANSHCRMYFFDEDKGAIVGPQISGSGTGNASIDTHYTKEVENGVTKLTPIANSSGNWVTISKAASITNARFFRLSLEGTGANLFVTINQPIE